jgi:hypothetical protein
MSLFGIVFVLSLMGLIKGTNPIPITIMSIINVFLGILAWIIDERHDRDFRYQKRGELHTKEERLDYNRRKMNNLLGVLVCTLLFTMIGLLLHFLL